MWKNNQKKTERYMTNVMFIIIKANQDCCNLKPHQHENLDKYR